jgi:photosystem II oxygen-evolving enhancer protein 3
MNQQADNARVSTAVNADRREVFGKIAAAGAAFLPVAANAAVGESPRFSVFGLIGDGSAYSEGAAYGSDQSDKLYSPYSVYGEASEKSLYKPDGAEYLARKKAILAETKVRLNKIPRYIQRKEWLNVRAELTRYMYETRGAVKGLAQSAEQKKKAAAFFAEIEKCNLAATQRKGDEAAAADTAAIAALDAFTASL